MAYSKLRKSHSPRQLVTIRDFAKVKKEIHVGPFGCGKTYACVEAFGLYCKRLQELGTVGLTFVLLGRTQVLVKKAMCNVLSKLYGDDFRYDGSRVNGVVKDAVLFGQNIYIIGLNDSGSESKFRGISDIMGILHDEVTLVDQNNFNYVMGRLRGEVDDSIVLPEGTVPMWYVGSTNPDVPTHWLKKLIDDNYFDKHTKWYRRDACWSGADKYYEDLEKTYRDLPSMFSRYIEGKWTSADKMVYPMFDYKKHVLVNVDVDVKQMQKIILGVDYGGNHPTALCLVAKAWSGEYIAFKTLKITHTAPSDIVQHIKEWMDYIKEKGSYISAIYVDPSAKGLKDELSKENIDYSNAINDHNYGIGTMRTLLSTDRSFVTDDCRDLISEIYGYRFKDTKNGKDEVYKFDDDLADSWRYAIVSDYAT